MAAEEPADLFERYESQYVRDLAGRLIRIEQATVKDLEETMTVTVDGNTIKDVPKAVPTTDDQGNILRDDKGNVKPRLTTVYDAATWSYSQQEPPKENPIPILCHQHHLRPIGVCRVCSVMTTRKGEPGSRLIPSCQHPLVDGMEVHTVNSQVPVKFPGSTEKVVAGEYVGKVVKQLVELLAVNHLHNDQVEDQKRYNNELQGMAKRFSIPVTSNGETLSVKSVFKKRAYDERKIDDSSQVIQVDHNQCILCDRCVRGCSEVKPFKIIGHTGFGNQATISFDLGKPMKESGCVSCGECTVSCPTGALSFKGSMYEFSVQKGQKNDPWKGDPLKPKTVPAKVLAQDPLFRDVPYSYLKWSEGAVGKKVLKANEILCREGEYGSTAFYVKTGELAIEVNKKVVASRTPEDVIVGEIACLSHQPRTATIKGAEDDTVVYVIKRNLLHMLMRNRGARNILGPIYRERTLNAYLQKGSLFRGMPDELSKTCIKYLQKRPDIAFVQADPEQVIFAEGNPAAEWYLVIRGHVSIRRNVGQGRSIVRNYLGRGTQFGEIGLLTNPKYSQLAKMKPANEQGVRTATCTAMDHVELISIPGAAFLGLLNLGAEIRDLLEGNAKTLLENDVNVPPPVDSDLNQLAADGLYQGQSLLVLDLNRCTRCQECVKACARTHPDDITRLVLEGNRFANYLVPSACRSCHDPLCLVGCPVDAIHRRPGEKSLAIVIEENRCIGCGLCAHNCPFGSIHMTMRPKGSGIANVYPRLATNCDLCETHMDGKPQCVHHCPHDAAMRMTGDELARMIGLKVVGTPAANKR